MTVDGIGATDAQSATSAAESARVALEYVLPPFLHGSPVPVRLLAVALEAAVLQDDLRRARVFPREFHGDLTRLVGIGLGHTI